MGNIWQGNFNLVNHTGKAVGEENLANKLVSLYAKYNSVCL